MACRNFFVMVMFAVMFLLSENVSAMTFSQPVEIGNVVAPPTVGLSVYNAVACNGTLKKDWKGISYYEIKYENSGVAQFRTAENSIYFYYEPNEKNRVALGNKNKSSIFPIQSGLYGFKIYQIPNDNNIKLYVARPVEAMAAVLDYTFLGKNKDGTFVKYFNFLDIWNKYVGNNHQNGRPFFTEDIQCAGDSIIIKYMRYEDNVKKIKGEFRFKWDDAAQWFSVEKIIY